MRKLLSLITALLFAGLTAMWAIPANPEPFKAKQPDGSTITLRLHGDEFYSWVTSEDGKTLYKKDANGWWRPAGTPKISRSAVMKAKELRRQRDAMFRPKGKAGLGLGWGDNHFLIILVEWADDHFSEGAGDYFKQIIGQKNYSSNGFAGSAKDFYYEASYGKFDPNFDVYGPIRLDRNHNDWVDNDTPGKHYETSQAMVREAITKLDATVDLSQYDCNGDGYIDNVYMIHAGYDAADHAENAIWSHAWDAYDGVLHDGVKIGSYATSAEFQGADGTTFDGIGTFCHEFGHVIGMPDLYDIDYADNGYALNPSMWNLMAGGSRNSDSKIPARLSSYERYILGYITDEDKVDLSTLGNKTLSGLSSKKLYYLPTINEGEFFIAEVHDGQNWDSPLPQGMIIYHTDQSNNSVHGTTGAGLWDDWSINVYGDHPCHYVVVPDETLCYSDTYWVNDGRYGNSFYALWTFPTCESACNYWRLQYNVTDYSPKAWDGSQPYTLKNIAYNNGQVTFSVAEGERSVTGVITASKTNIPVKDAVVVVEPQSQQSASRRVVSLAIAKKNAIAEGTTDEDGKYKVVLPDNAPENLVISVFAEGYLSEQVNVSGRSVKKDFVLNSVMLGGIAETFTKTVFPVPAGAGACWGDDQTGTNYTVAQKYTAEELKSLAGGQINSIFYSSYATGENIYVFVDFGTTTRAICRKVNNPNAYYFADGFSNKVDISDANIIIPENTDIYIGYTIQNANHNYPIFVDGGPKNEGSLLLYEGFSTTEAGGNKWIDPAKEWEEWKDINNALIGASITPPLSINPDAKLTEMGICYIELPTTLTAGNSLPLKLVYSKASMPYEVEWYYDGAKIDSQYVSLESGKHTLRASLKFNNGKPGYSVDVKFTVQ